MNEVSFSSFRRIIVILLFLFTTPVFSQSQIHFAVIGDYGKSGSNELAVSELVKSWNPDFIVTVGDNNYESGSASTIDENIGQYYHEFIFPYIGTYGQGAATNKFFPSPGNHDWRASDLTPYRDYFELPNNERYYDFTAGNIHFFMLDSDGDEPDGNSSSSIQASWFYNKISTSNSTWKIVCFHHPPYSSGQHGSNSNMQQWDFPQTGATTVIAGHDHTYERIEKDGFTYFVNGLGEKSLYNWSSTVSGSQVRYNDNYGAMLVDAYIDSIVFKFIDIDNNIIDTYSIVNATTFVESENLVKSFELKQNYPNPFNPGTTIRFELPLLGGDKRGGLVVLKVFDVLGNEVATLVNEDKPAGTYEVEWNANNFPSGVYFYRLQIYPANSGAGGFVETKKMTLLK